MAADKVRWGILGNATIARVCVIPALHKARNCTLQALGTRSPGAVEKLAEASGISRVYEGYDGVLSDPAVDVVYIPLPNHLHREWTLKAIKAGKHVLCEKPLACTADEAHDMAQAAHAAGLLLMEAFMYRFHPRTLRIRDLIREGRIGTLRLVRSSFCFPMDEAILEHAGNYRLMPEAGGGALLDVGCYGVSAARFLFSEEPQSVQAQALYSASGVDVHLVGILRFTSGGFATIEASFITALQQTYTLVGSHGAVELPHNAFIPGDREASYCIHKQNDETGRVYTVPGADEYCLMVEHFAEAVLEQKQLSYTPEDSIGNMRVLDALAQAARTGEQIFL
jgi:D-xylose 1-dehydrogenase (NADP+, D-xylono-1,5-lactone-forming)